MLEKECRNISQVSENRNRILSTEQQLVIIHITPLKKQCYSIINKPLRFGGSLVPVCVCGEGGVANDTDVKYIPHDESITIILQVKAVEISALVPGSWFYNAMTTVGSCETEVFCIHFQKQSVNKGVLTEIVYLNRIIISKNRHIIKFKTQY